MTKHAEMGIVTKMIGTNDEYTDNRAPYSHFSVVDAPDEAAARTFEADLRAIGWDDYFDQVNARGEARGVEEAIAERIGM